jgi:hypothetical protein
MTQDSTRRLLKVFGIAVTDLEDALESGAADAARTAAAECRARLREVTALVEELADRATRLA